MASLSQAKTQVEPKGVIRVATLREQKEGGGFTIRRSVGSSAFSNTETDPFLMCAPPRA